MPLDTEILLHSSPGAALLTVFLAGILSLLTPCVYPLIPVTIGLFGVQPGLSRKRSFVLALFYVAGISSMYTLLGVISAKTGMLFGSMLGKPVVIIGISALLILLILLLLDIVQIPSISAIQNRASRVGGRGLAGAFLMGTVSGIVAAPCVGPILVVILGIAAASANIIWGAILLFTYSIGFGLPFILLATFSGLLSKIPRAGNWLLTIKILIASALVLVLFFVLEPLVNYQRLMPSEDNKLAVAAVLIPFSLIFAGFSIKRSLKSLALLSATLLAVAIYPFLVTAASAPSPTDLKITWLNSIDTALKQAEKKNGITIVDFTAEWCASCHELEALTFSDARVVPYLKRFSTARIDLTDFNDSARKLTERYKIPGLPAVIFLDDKGEEIPRTRISGFIKPEKFILHLKKIEALKNSS
ncbi:MAG: hypothetical protein D6719_09205 [Candidatus Dadabacteria bacterium]|nr:MAG: hypothetical protein D6719_09205 [Candidatus Dadabacteria bacterium]